jgi:hypothetical protein
MAARPEREARVVNIPSSPRLGPWLFERILTALMVGGLLLVFLLVGLGLT